MFVSDSAGGRVIVVDRRGALLAEIIGRGGASMRPLGSAVNRKSDLFFADALGVRALKYESRSGAGRFSAGFGGGGSLRVGSKTRERKSARTDPVLVERLRWRVSRFEYRSMKQNSVTEVSMART
jgi:hypothetical protein